jgi:tetratricopeptide (TPR) repeat protein
VRVIALEPLPRDEVVRLVEAATAEMPLLPHDVSLVADRAGGNPQFALDLAQVVASGGMLPESIETAAMARIDALAPADRDLVRRTSVLGNSFALRFLPDVLDADAPSPDDETWERLGEFFAEDGDGYVRFRRAVVRDAAYAGLPFRTRRALHAKIASRFESEYNPEETGGLLSLHYFLAGDLERAWPYARQAAVRAEEQFAHQEAAQLYRRAIDAAARLPRISQAEVGDLYRALGDALIRYGELRAADEASAKELRYQKDDPVQSGRALLKRAKIQSRLQTFSRALWWISRSRSVLAGSDRPEAAAVAADAAAFYAVTLNRLGRTTESARWGRRAVEEAEASGNQRALAESFDLLDSINMEAGEPIGEYWDRAFEIYGAIGDLSAQERVVANKGVGLQAEGRFDEAMASYERSREIAEQIGDVYASAISMMNEAEIHSDRGSLDVAEELLEKSVRFLRASGDSYMIAGSLQYLGRVLARLGRTDAALTSFAESEEGFAEIGAIPDATEVQVLRAECFVLSADPRAALDQLGRLRDQKGLGEQFRSIALRTTGYARSQLGERAAAREAFLMALDDGRRRGAGFDVLEASVALTRLGQLEDQGPFVVDPEIESIVERLGIVAVTYVPLTG